MQMGGTDYGLRQWNHDLLSCTCDHDCTCITPRLGPKALDVDRGVFRNIIAYGTGSIIDINAANARCVVGFALTFLFEKISKDDVGRSLRQRINQMRSVQVRNLRHHLGMTVCDADANEFQNSRVYSLRHLGGINITPWLASKRSATYPVMEPGVVARSSSHDPFPIQLDAKVMMVGHPTLGDVFDKINTSPVLNGAVIADFSPTET
ncbi:MAG: hypothetical protein SGARI_004823, partial [Bacillariaceae sp.]